MELVSCSFALGLWITNAGMWRTSLRLMKQRAEGAVGSHGGGCE